VNVPVEAPLPFHYLAVDGPIGVGKTTLVEMLAERFAGVKVLEDVDNPFLGDFYADRPGAAFQTELYFLLSRYKQQQEMVAQRGLFERLLIADYTFQKNRVFAYLNLTDDELLIFDKLFALLEPQVPKPDLVLYLVADVDTCMERIRRRQRAVEKSIAPSTSPSWSTPTTTTTTTTRARRSSSSTPATCASPTTASTSTT
jgi:deoxyguanosine kinase